MAEGASSNQEPAHEKGSRGIAARLTDGASRFEKGSQEGFASPNPGGNKIANKFVANGGKNQTLSPSPAMAAHIINVPGNEVPLHAQVTRTRQDYRNDSTRGVRNGNKQGLASPKPCSDKIANKAMPNFLENQMPWRAEETRASEDHRTVYTRRSKNGNNQGLLLPKPRGSEIANKVTTNKKMDSCVKNGKQLNAERLSAILARLEQKRAWGKPPPKRGDVKKAIVEAGVKKFIDTGKTFCCAPGPVDVDAIVRDLPFPTRSEPTATLWAKVEE